MNFEDRKTPEHVAYEKGYQQGVNAVLAALHIKFYTEYSEWSGVGVLKEILKDMIKQFPKDIFKQE